MGKSAGPATRRGEHLKTVRTALLNWRIKTYQTYYSPSPFTSVVILPDPTLTALASNARIRTIDDIQQTLKPPWIFASKHGQEVLELLEKLDKVEKEGREHEKLKRREEKKEETAQRREAKKQHSRMRKSAVRPPLSSVYFAPTPKTVLGDSMSFNTPAHLTNTGMVCNLISFFLKLG